jgi:hypothetical protein
MDRKPMSKASRDWRHSAAPEDCTARPDRDTVVLTASPQTSVGNRQEDDWGLFMLGDRAGQTV